MVQAEMETTKKQKRITGLKKKIRGPISIKAKLASTLQTKDSVSIRFSMDRA